VEASLSLVLVKRSHPEGRVPPGWRAAYC
jgi:hypothetical protein